MRISLLQTAPVWGDPSRSRIEISQWLEGMAPTDLLVLPEMFSTGFVTHPEGVAETEGGESLAWMQETARKRGCAVAGSLSVGTENGYRNRLYFVFPDGSYRFYDKRHLFTYGKEHLRYQAGEERVIVSYGGFRILLQVCYDLRFPVFARNRIVDGVPDYDLILYVACWPESRIAAWDTLLRARAIENVCFVAGVNRVGDEPGNHYCGHSCLIGPRGEVLSICKENEASFVEYEIKKADLDSFRASFPALSDADNQ
ncbi:MAG: nitrilase family protein [Bacteroidales bacterium]|nr:nitrilase family protein [Bacteroidales bacterium]